MAASAPRASDSSDRRRRAENQQQHITISPASSNVNLKFGPQFGGRGTFENVFSTSSSLRTLFKRHRAFKAAFGSREFGGRGRRNNNPRTRYAPETPGRIVAMSTETPLQGGKTAVVTDACTTTEFEVARASEGLVTAIRTAYNTHCDLVLRPDDVWLTILAQFCVYVNKNAEGLRDRIVFHEGKKELKVEGYGSSLKTADYPRMIRELLGQLRQNIKSPELADWFRPGFSTTTENDEVCAAATTMASLQKYFEYKMMLAVCGIPSVTLMGTVEDWKLLREKVERLLEFEVHDNPEGNVMEVWVGYLRKVCDGFVESTEHPESPETLAFWDKVVSETGGGCSIPTYITGWLTAFACFDIDGNFWGNRTTRIKRSYHPFSETSDSSSSSSSSSEFPQISDKSICHNVVSCPVIIDDDGRVHDGRLIVGQVAMDVRRPAAAGGYPTVRPRNDWCLAVAVEYNENEK